MVDFIISNSAAPDQNTYKNPFYAMQAADDLNSGFKMIPELDMGGPMASNTPTQLADFTAPIAAYKSAYHLADGRLALVAFEAEAQPPAYWTEYFNILKTKYGITVAFVPCFVNAYLTATIPGTTTTYADGFAPISYGFSNWGGRNTTYNSAANIAYTANDAHQRGKIWAQPVSLQDVRPQQGIYDEADNTENLKATWTGAMANNAEWVQITTWNDYAENTGISPSTKKGWSPMDINAYYLIKYKLGAYPAITRDTIYVSHRTQPAAAIPTGGQTLLMKLRGGSPARDKVEVLSFLTAPGTVEATIGGNVVAINAPAGEARTLFDLASGSVAARVLRNNQPVVSVDSPFAVTSTPVVQNLIYQFVSSGREGLVYSSVNTPPPAPTPTLTVTSPVINATVIGITKLTGNYAGLQNIEIWKNGSSIATATLSFGVWTANIDTTKQTNGSNTYTVQGWDVLAGQTATIHLSQDIALNVNNPVVTPTPTPTPTADTTGPTITITQPIANSVVQNNVTISVATTDTSGVAKINLYIDGSFYSTTQGDILTTSWNTKSRKVARGAHTLKVAATDTLGNTSSSSITVNIK